MLVRELVLSSPRWKAPQTGGGGPSGRGDFTARYARRKKKRANPLTRDTASSSVYTAGGSSSVQRTPARPELPVPSACESLNSTVAPNTTHKLRGFRVLLQVSWSKHVLVATSRKIRNLFGKSCTNTCLYLIWCYICM